MLFMLISEVFFKKENYYFLKKIKLNLNKFGVVYLSCQPIGSGLIAIIQRVCGCKYFLFEKILK